MPKILVADDEEELLELIRFSFDSNGFEVVTANNGRKALEISRSEAFDLVVLDVMMPEMDGYHVAHEISENPNGPPVLLLTSRDFRQDQSAIQGSGATAFLSKPFEVPELLEVAKDLISKNKKN